MKKQKYRYRYKTKDTVTESTPKKTKTSFSVRQRLILLVSWGLVAVGLYAVLAKFMFVYSLWIFALLFTVCFILYFITAVRVARYTEQGKGESEECIKLIDRGKILLIIMIPLLLVIMYDFVFSTFKMFM